MTDEELKKLVASLAEAQRKTDEQLKKTNEQLKETDEQIKRTVQVVEKISEEMKKLGDEVKSLRDELKKVGDEVKLVSRDVDKLFRLYGGASNNQGMVAEEFFFNSLKHRPILDGIRFDFIMNNVNRHKGKLQDQYDILLVDGKIVYLIEVKYKLHKNDMENFMQKKLPNFRILFPEYKDYEVRVAFASFSIENQLIEYAKDLEVTLLQRRGKVFQTLAA